MRNLLKVDLKRVFKDKLFTVVCIIAAIFALMMPLIYVAIFSLFGGDFNETNELMGVFGMSITGKSMFFSSFSISNNLGIVVPVLLAIILCKDFSQGTVRNKIIGGKSRTSVFMSMYSVCFFTLFGVVLLHALLTLLISLIFFPYQLTDFSASDMGYFFTSLLFEALLYVFIASLVSYLCVAMKNTGLAVVSYIAIIMIMSFVTPILQFSIIFLSASSSKETEIAIEIIEFIQKINIFNFTSVIGTGAKYSTEEILCCILSPLFGSVALASLGIIKFNRKDLK